MDIYDTLRRRIKETVYNSADDIGGVIWDYTYDGNQIILRSAGYEALAPYTMAAPDHVIGGLSGPQDGENFVIQEYDADGNLVADNIRIPARRISG